MCSILRNQQTDFQSSYTILHSHQQCMRVPISPQFTSACFLFDDSHLNKREMVFHGFCLHFPDDEWLSIFLYIYRSFVYLLLRNDYINSWLIFNLDCRFCYQVVSIPYMLYIQVLYWLHGFQNILPIYELPFHFLSGVLSKAFKYN